MRFVSVAIGFGFLQKNGRDWNQIVTRPFGIIIIIYNFFVVVICCMYEPVHTRSTVGLTGCQDLLYAARRPCNLSNCIAIIHDAFIL